MRICLVSHEYPPETADGGIGTQTWNKAHGLTQLGHSVEVLSCAATALDEPMRTGNESGITVHRLRSPGHASIKPVPIYDQAPYLVGYTWSVLQGLHELITEQPFDLINFPEYGGEGFAFQMNRTVYNWVPVVVQLHAPTAMLAERMGWPDQESGFYRTASFMEGESIRLADGWMASSANIADFSAELYQIPRDSIDVVHCGVDCVMFRPDAKSLADNRRPTVLYVGNISTSKGLVNIFEAILRLRDRYPRILLRVVGRENELWSKLRAKAKAAGAEDNFVQLPYVKEREAVPKLFQQADVFASPADHENGVANVYVEAMACGCPVIAANTGGASEAVVDGRTGLLVPPRDVEGAVAAIDRILSDDQLRSSMRAAARQRAVEYFSRDKYIERVLSAYHKTIERSREKLDRLRVESDS